MKKKLIPALIILAAGFLTHLLGGLIAVTQGEAALFGFALDGILLAGGLAAMPFLLPAILQLDSRKPRLMRHARLTAALTFPLGVLGQTACFLQLSSDAQAALAFFAVPVLTSGVGVLLLGVVSLWNRPAPLAP